MSNDRKIRVLEIVPALNVDSGVASFSMNYLRKMDHSKFTIDFALYSLHDTPYYDEIKRFGGKVYLLPGITFFMKHINECTRILHAGKYDIIHDNALTKSLPLMWCASIYKIPVRILHSHNASLGDSKRKVLQRKIILSQLKKLSTNCFACSDAAGKCYFESQPYLLVPNVIEEGKYKYDRAIRERVRLERGAEKKIVICTVGRLAAQKNPYFALDVIKALSKKYENLEYWWVGTGSIESDVREYTHQQGLDNTVSFLGARKDMVELYHGADIFFLPSIFEGLPVTGIEAQAVGLPSVLSDTITKEMVYTDLVEYVPLDAPIEIWVEVIEKQMKRIPNRRSYTKELENSVFSSAHAGERLESYYERLLKEATI